MPVQVNDHLLSSALRAAHGAEAVTSPCIFPGLYTHICNSKLTNMISLEAIKLQL